ncbi:hypothetical protein [Nostoc sp. UHCC 0251]|uniref:hypothetical protein n=1 Tax=Nostoc sp. UHCC 0251 TaxID=3110240 RepID=UPI002B204810|nr:hypothetical protein [Nostoc sp. UHCC 0251]MEA5622722.1 hypothetical protein [Nostoc sp. UHCC 0251]
MPNKGRKPLVEAGSEIDSAIGSSQIVKEAEEFFVFKLSPTSTESVKLTDSPERQIRPIVQNRKSRLG